MAKLGEVDAADIFGAMSVPSRGVGGGGSIPRADEGVDPGAQMAPGLPENVLIRPGGNEWGQPVLTPEAEASHRKAQASHRGKHASAKGAQGERDVLNEFRSVMRAVEDELKSKGLIFVARSDFATRKRLERGTSNRDIGNMPIISIEVKRNESLNVNAAWQQCTRQADGGLLPVLVYRFNREPWRVRTWGALTHYDGSGAVVHYAVTEVSLVDFLAYYTKLYRAFITEGLVS